MGARYAVTCTENAVTSGYTSAGSVRVVTAGDKRPRVYDFIISQSGTPADNSISWRVQRHTATGAYTGVAATPLDPADGSVMATGFENASAEPTYTAGSELWENAINERASYRWVAAPGGDLIIPSTASNGIGFQVLSTTYTGAAEVTVHFEE
jgi:hypothetical protein